MTKTERLTRLSLLTAAASILFIVELQLPNLTAIPGIKIGLANIVTVYAVYRFRAYETVMLVISRILIGAFFSSNISAVIYSLSGAFLCLFGMLILKNILTEKYIPLCSIFGGILHNTGQIAAAVVFMNSFAVLSYYPYLVIAGAAAGAFTGLSAGFVLNRLSKKI